LITFSSASSLGAASFAAAPATDQTLICFSHLRWNFVFQRPQHLMSRFTKERRVIYWEEPEVALPDFEPSLGVRECAETGVIVVTPSLPEQMTDEERSAALKSLLDGFLAGESKPLIRWYYTPMMLPFSRHVDAICTVYDCMDELANFRFARRAARPGARAARRVRRGLHRRLQSLRRPRRAGIPTSTRSRRASTASISAARAPRSRRTRRPGAITTPRFGFYGVIDERMDLE
jgi:UDP-galactopyranose mutase